MLYGVALAGQLSAQRIVLEIVRVHGYAPGDLLVEKADQRTEGAQVFVEELIVRRELADNACYFNPQYDSVEGFPGWAKQSLTEHRYDEQLGRYHHCLVTLLEDY